MMQRFAARIRTARRRPDDGFTLIELLVVIAIIGVLTALLIPRVIQAMSSATANAAVQTAESIAAAFESYYDANGAFPAKGSTSGVATCGQASVTSGTTYNALQSALAAFGATMPADPVSAGFWLFQGNTPEPQSSVSNAGAICLAGYTVNSTFSGYDLLLYARNSDQTPILINVTAGGSPTGCSSSGTPCNAIFVGTAIPPASATLAGGTGITSNAINGFSTQCLSGACKFGETVNLPW